MMGDIEKDFLEDLLRVNPSVASLYHEHNPTVSLPYTPRWVSKEEEINAVMNRVFGMARLLTTEQAQDLIPLIAHHFGPEYIHREFFRKLKGKHSFYAKFNHSNFPKWSDYWEYELTQREKIDGAFVCKIHDIFAFRSDIHPSDYITHIRALAGSCSAFGFDAGDNSMSTITLFFDNEEDEIIARVKLAEMVAE